MFSTITPSAAEIAASRPGDHIVAADVVMDRAFTVEAPPEQVWPWLVQLGKRRAGWYLPSRIELIVPRARRASRRIDARWQRLRVAEVIPDYGGRDATFEVVMIEPPASLVYRSQRGHTRLSWSITLTPLAAELHSAATATRVHLRLRLAPVRHRRLAEAGGGLIDALTVAGLAAGLRERLAARTP
jgi:Polyketide cyclase / dehydrase and lipid transport